MASDSQTARPIWSAEVSMYWRPDCFGRAERALYVGGLNVGTVMHHATGRQKSWRAWLMTDEDGEEIGWYMTEREAKDALEDAAARKLCE